MTNARPTLSLRRALGAAALLLAPLCASLALPRTAAGQLPPKRTLARQGQSACQSFPRPVAPSLQQSLEARRLAQQGYEAALVGDHPEARDLLRRAAQLDLTSQEVAYRLGREHEEVGAATDAILEYCRYLSLAPKAGNFADVRERITRLSGQTSLTASDVTAAQFAAGVAHLQAGRLAEARTAFTSVIASSPGAAAGHFNLGVVHASMGEPELAIRDLRRYLALERPAPDRRAVERELRRLERQLLKPGSALGWGLAVPGGGQMYTRRRLFGIAVAATVGGALLYAIQPDPRRTVVDTTEFGTVYTYTLPGRSYSNVGAGVGVAAAVAIASAAESYFYARRGREGMPSRRGTAARRMGTTLRPLVAPGEGGGATVGASLSF